MKHNIYFRTLLAKKNIKTSDLAKKIGITTATLNRKIQGKIRFVERDIKIILDELGMTYEEVFKSSGVSVITINEEKFIVSESVVSEVMEIIKKEVI